MSSVFTWKIYTRRHLYRCFETIWTVGIWMIGRTVWIDENVCMEFGLCNWKWFRRICITSFYRLEEFKAVRTQKKMWRKWFWSSCSDRIFRMYLWGVRHPIRAQKASPFVFFLMILIFNKQIQMFPLEV